ncbi:hypothetical protein Dsin_005346 [Dipteronia sinensis]|uniref:GH16 domain-containing protein n=1 Tax=Dipteronia sinensis TaxID=43782 RepID=A0AAE0AXQ1_9ROSI|nr:hypothetical protein Dsin_005346 [Dipteronia sinensis]
MNMPLVPIGEGCTQLFGNDKLIVHRDGKFVHLSLDERIGSRFVSHDLYLHGFFNASIKLPAELWLPSISMEKKKTYTQDEIDEVRLE